MTTPFFSMARAIVRTDFAHSTRAHTMDRIICLEEAVLVAGRVAARLVHSRLAVSSPLSHLLEFQANRSGRVKILLSRKGLPVRWHAEEQRGPATKASALILGYVD